MLSQSCRQFPEIIDSVRLTEKAAQIFVLMPGEANHDEVHCRYQEPPHRMGKAEPVELIDDEQTEDDNRNGIVPKFFTQQAHDQP